MAPKKGKTNNPDGRPRGIPNKLTAELRASLKAAISGHIERIDKRLDGLQIGFPAWLSVKQCADHLSVSSSQVRKLVSSGSIPYRRIGGCLRFNRKMVDLWVLSGEQKPSKRTQSTFEAFL